MIDYLVIREDRMLAEGSADFKPSEKQIAEAIKKRGYIASGIKINYDSLQQFWRFTAVIKDNKFIVEGVEV